MQKQMVKRGVAAFVLSDAQKWFPPRNFAFAPIKCVAENAKSGQGRLSNTTKKKDNPPIVWIVQEHYIVVLT